MDLAYARQLMWVLFRMKSLEGIELQTFGRVIDITFKPIDKSRAG